MATHITCLLVDDVEENLIALAALLRQDDVEILTARSGVEALELLLGHDVAVAFIDVQMPEMDGFELAELMRGSERTRRIPIIFVTAANREPARAFRGYQAGAVDFLYKPIDPIVLETKAAVFFELHRQKQLLAAELQQRSETLRLNEMFTAVLGHELRNPLNAIVTAGLLLQRQPAPEVVCQTATMILGSGRRMARMIDDLLDLTRARLTNGIPLARTPSNLAVIVSRVVQELHTAHPNREIDVRTAGDLDGHWDEGRLQQLASNLIGNAVQHGTPTEAVTVTADGTDTESVVLRVTNAGSIPQDALPRLFDPFGGRQRQRADGLGLGLYIAQQIAYAHHGRIDVASSEDTGTVFTARFPRRPTAQGA